MARTDTNRQWTTYRILDATIDNADLADPLNLGATGASEGKGFILWGDTPAAKIEWDEVNDRLLTTSATIRFGTTDKLEFRDANHYIQSDATNDLMVNAGTLLNLAIAGADEVTVSSTALYPSTDNGQTLGILNSNEWSDLFLADGGVIGWNNNDVTITHDASQLTVAGGSLIVTEGHISIAPTKYIYFDGYGGGEHIGSQANILSVTAQTEVDIVIGSTDELQITSGGVTLPTNNLTVSAGNIAVAQGYNLYFSGQGGLDFIASDAAGYLTVNATTGIDFVIGGLDEINLTASSFSPAFSDGIALGTTSKQWSDLFLASDGVINFDGGDVTLTHTAAGQLVINASYAGAAICLTPTGGTSSYIHLGSYLKLWLTDTDGTGEGWLWYDNSENKIKFYTGSAVRTVISSDSLGDVTIARNLTVTNQLLMPVDKNLAFTDATNYIQGSVAGQIIVVATYDGAAICLNPSGGSAYIHLGKCLRLANLASGIAITGALWFDTTDSKLHFYDGVAERTVNSA